MFAHIVNPVLVGPESDLHTAQPITFQSLATARDFARGLVAVSLFSAQYPEDQRLVPVGFVTTPDLQRSVLDLGNFHRKRKLPVLADILDRLYAASPDSEYVIYSNVDIAVLPHFYAFLHAMVVAGHDAIVVTRRTVPASYTDQDLALMYADLGRSHPGYDCFVFRRTVYPSYRLGHACIGVPWVGRLLLLNLICHASNFVLIKDRHLTFHLGDDRKWTGSDVNDYFEYNKTELSNILIHYQATLPDRVRHYRKVIRKNRTTHRKIIYMLEHAVKHLLR